MKRLQTYFIITAGGILLGAGCAGNNTYGISGATGGGTTGGGVLGAWPKYQHDSQNTGQVVPLLGRPRLGTRGSLGVAWNFTTGGLIANNAAIGADGSVVFVSSDSNVYSVNGVTGQSNWTFALERGDSSSPIIGPDGTVFVGGGSQMHALDPVSGAERWHFDFQPGFGNAIRSTPLLTSQGTLCLADGRGVVYGLDSATGAQRWTFTALGSVEGPLGLGADGNLYLPTGDSEGHTFHAINAETGAPSWDFQADDYMEGGTAIATDGTIIFGTRTGDLFALNPNGSLRWRFNLEGTRSTPSIGPNGTVYAYSNSRVSCNAVSLANGAKLWETAIGGVSLGGPAVAATGTVVVAGSDLLYLNPATGAIARTMSLGTSLRTSSPSIGLDSKVYIGGANGHMFAIQ